MSLSAAKEDEERPSFFPVEPAWTVRLPGPALAPPAYDAERAFLATRDGQFLAIDLSRGRVAWTIPLESRVPPAQGNSRVFIALTDRIHAVLASTGRTAWTAAVGGVTAPLYWHSGWLIAATDAEVIALRDSDGAEIWRRNYGAPVRAEPTIDGDRLYLSLQDGRVIAATLATGAPVWERRLGGAAHEVLVAGDRAFVGSDDNFFYCLSERNGNIKWRWRTGADVTGRAYADEAHVYFTSLDNVLRALDRGNGAQRWKQGLAVRPSAGPTVVSDGAALVISGLGAGIRAFNTKDGTPAGQFTAGAELVAPTHLYEDPKSPRLIIVTTGGVIQALSHSYDPAIVPLRVLPGLLLAPERDPTAKPDSPSDAVPVR